MAANDTFHDAVRSALVKDAWIITDDPLYLKVSKQIGMYIDLAAEKLLTAERNGQKIAVEIKSFLGLSAINEFHLALGQFLNYRLALTQLEPDRILYLAIPKDVYVSFFRDTFIQQALITYHVHLIVFDPVKEVVTLWMFQTTDA